MKRFFKSAPFLVLLMLTFGVGVYFAGSATAQEATTETSSNLLIQKLDSLIDALLVLTEQSGSEEGSAESGGISTLAGAAGQTTPSCLDNYESWPTSRFWKNDSSWDLHSMVPKALTGSSGVETSQFMDVNGDGLVDQLFISRQHMTSSTVDGNGNNVAAWYRMKYCLNLNNGSGWDIAYKCYGDAKYINGQSELHYYGDCADI